MHVFLQHRQSLLSHDVARGMRGTELRLRAGEVPDLDSCGTFLRETAGRPASHSFKVAKVANVSRLAGLVALAIECHTEWSPRARPAMPYDAHERFQ